MEALPIQVVAFAIPYPPDYGGVIDVFYKIRALAKAGAMIDLHCFQYGGRKTGAELNALCAHVFTYPRKTEMAGIVGSRPYIVASRRDAKLLRRLKDRPGPILFEGVHACQYLDHPDLKDRTKIVRLHNIEWTYYRKLASLEKQPLKRIYYGIESARLRKFEQNVYAHADLLLCISTDDLEEVNRHVEGKSRFMPPFHAYDSVDAATGKGSYILFHGDLGVRENVLSAQQLIRHVFGQIAYPVVIAGRNPPPALKRLVASHPNIQLRPDVSDADMREIMRMAHIHVLHGYNPAGFKLKLVHALFSGRYCLANTAVLSGTGLADCVISYASFDRLKTQIHKLMGVPFSRQEIDTRKKVLFPTYSNFENAKRILQLIRNQALHREK